MYLNSETSVVRLPCRPSKSSLKRERVLWQGFIDMTTWGLRGVVLEQGFIDMTMWGLERGIVLEQGFIDMTTWGLKRDSSSAGVH